MIKKIIRYLGYLSLPSMIIACATTNSNRIAFENAQNAITTNLVSKEIAQVMEDSDWNQLTILISTAKIHETVTWDNPSSGYAYNFSSLNIFVNAKGQACRTYQVKIKKLFLKKQTSPLTACRINDGSWKTVSNT